MAACAVEGGCPSDYAAVAVAVLSILVLIAKAAAAPKSGRSSFWLVAIQILASFNLLLSIVMALGFFRYGKHWWRSCYIWAIWVEGPLGFGLLLSCRIAHAFQLYNIFVKRRLPPIRSYAFLPLVLLPWIAGAAFIHMRKPLNHRCHMKTQWIVPVLALHALYVAALIIFTAAVRHIEFRFHELKALWRGILLSIFCIGIWVVAYILNEVHEESSPVQIISRAVLLSTTSFIVVAFFTTSVSTSLTKKKPQSMGEALGIKDSGHLLQKERICAINPKEPLDKLLCNRRFRRSFLEFADSCLAGESVRFYEDVQQFEKIPVDDHVRRIYMARHIIDEYIVQGATMEVNISHRCRQEILSTTDLASPDLFKTAKSELLHLMKTNLAGDYWSSAFFAKLKEEEASMEASFGPEVEQWNLSSSHRLSFVHCEDDPFYRENSPRKSGSSRRDLEHRCGEL